MECNNIFGYVSSIIERRSLGTRVLLLILAVECLRC